MTDSRVLKTIIAEAGGDPAAMAAVAAVINNRAQQTGKTPLQVVQQRNQFEGYSNPGPAISKQLNDAKLLARAEQAYSGVASGTIPDPTNGGTQFRAASASSGLHAPHGTVNIGGNVFAKGNSAPQTALSAINTVAPTPQSRPTSTLGYEPSQPSVRAISVNPNGSPILPQMKLPQDAMYGINRLDPSHVTHAPTDFTTQNVGVPDARLSQLNAPLPQPANAFAGSRGSVGASSSELVSHPVQTLRIDPLTNQVISGNQPQSLQDALNVYAQRQALNTNGGSVKTTTAQAGNVALPKGVVPKQAAADLAAITKPNAFSGAVASIGAQSPQVASTGFATFTPNGMKPTLPSSTVNAASPLDNRYLGLTNTPPVPASVSAIAAATQPFAGSAAAIRARAPLPRAPSSAAIPLTSFNAVNPVSQILPRVQSTFNSSPIGHVTSLLTGQPIQGGLLGMLFNQGGLFNTSSPPATQATSVPVPVVGYNGNANVYSNELAGANQGFGGENAVMPDSMNNKRWLTGY